MGEYYEERPFKIHAKRKREKYGEMFLKKTTNWQRHKQWQLNRVKQKTTIIHPRQRQKLCEQKLAENNSKLLLLGKTDFDPEEILDKLLLFDLKKNNQR